MSSPLSSVPDLPIGFEYIEELGAGASAHVYLAVERALGRKVALKRIDPGVMHSDQSRQMTVHEGRVLARLRHPHIGSVYDIRPHADAFWLVMEYVPGLSLQDLLDVNSMIPLSTAYVWAAQIADALVEAEALGIVHRDLKPANIIVDREWNCRVVDFGIALQGADDGEQALMGTPAYVSPEQVMGAPASSASDVYSLGLVTYQMVTGEHPFLRPGDSIQEVLQSQVAAEPVSPRRLRKTVSRRASWTILSALRKDPEKRPSAAQFGSAMSKARA